MGWSNDGRIPVDNEEICFRYSSQNRKQKCGIFKMDLQDKTCAIDGSIEKYKEIFVAIGLSQKEGIDYEETFDPVVRYTSIRTIMVLASIMNWDLH